MRTSAVILAAGAGTRLGGVAKALLVGNDGRTYLQRILETVREVGAQDPIIVVGAPHADAVATHAWELGHAVVVNPHPDRGMASSVAVGFDSLGTVEAAWLWPVDHPVVMPSTLRALMAALVPQPETRTLGHDAARPVYHGRGGHPPLIGSRLFKRFIDCAVVDGGARAVLSAADMLDVAVDDPGCVRDVDTRADLEAV